MIQTYVSFPSKYTGNWEKGTEGLIVRWLSTLAALKFIKASITYYRIYIWNNILYHVFEYYYYHQNYIFQKYNETFHLKNKSIGFLLDIGSERYTFSFTIRDSPTHFINATSWGNEDYIRSLSDSFRIGECGKLALILKLYLL